jgi:hypothetical protein
MDAILPYETGNATTNYYEVRRRCWEKSFTPFCHLLKRAGGGRLGSWKIVARQGKAALAHTQSKIHRTFGGFLAREASWSAERQFCFGFETGAAAREF